MTLDDNPDYYNNNKGRSPPPKKHLQMAMLKVILVSLLLPVDKRTHCCSLLSYLRKREKLKKLLDESLLLPFFRLFIAC